MTKHKKPTPEELDEGIKKSIEEAEKLKDAPVVTPEEPKEPVEEPKVIIPKEPEEEETPEPPKEPEVEPELKELEKESELKKKLAASARENQKIYAARRVLNKAILDTDEIPEPTENELAKEYKDWDVMSDVERSLAKETTISRNWRAKIKEAQDQVKKIEKWNESIGTFADDPQILIDYPELEGKQDEFKVFATNEENNNVPYKLLVGAFLHEHSTNKVSHKGQMFETGSGGPNEKPIPKSSKLTLEEGRLLRETSYDEWKKKVKNDEIEIDI